MRRVALILAFSLTCFGVANAADDYTYIKCPTDNSSDVSDGSATQNAIEYWRFKKNSLQKLTSDQQNDLAPYWKELCDGQHICHSNPLFKIDYYTIIIDRFIWHMHIESGRNGHYFSRDANCSKLAFPPPL